MVGRQGTVEDVELSLESLGDVIPTTPWMNHGTHHLYVHNVCELSWLLQVVKATHFHLLTCDFICHLHEPHMSASFSYTYDCLRTNITLFGA